MAAKSTVLVYGGAGQLGEAVVSHFKSNGWKAVSIDLRDSATADHSFVLDLSGGLERGVRTLIERLKAQSLSFDSVLHVAGGWTGGNIRDENLISGVERMINFNLLSAVCASHVAAATLKENGLLVITGAKAALGPTPGMIAYGISKAGAHQLISSLAEENSGLPKGAVVVGILPITLDTQSNRQAMPGANYDDWTPLSTVASLLYGWSSGQRPKNGELVQIITKNKITEFVPVTK